MAYNGRRGPNVSEYIANLNAIPSASDIQAADSGLSFEDDLAMFTNTQFFDFDMGQDADLSVNFGSERNAAPAPEDIDLSKPFDLVDGMLCLLLSLVSAGSMFFNGWLSAREVIAVIHSITVINPTPRLQRRHASASANYQTASYVCITS